MILYLDTSALAKRYIAERGSAKVADLIAKADITGTCLITRAEMAAALAKAVRMGVLPPDGARTALDAFRKDWPNLARVQITEAIIARADGLAWDLGLRGYDAVHLASALFWQDAMGDWVTFATFDLKLWQAAALSGLQPEPEHLPLA